MKINEEEFKKMFNEGYTIMELSIKFKCSRTPIYNKIKELNINRNFRNRKIINEEEFIKYYNEGYTKIQLSIKFDCTIQKINKTLKQFNLNKNFKKLVNIDKEEFLKYLNEGYSKDQLRKKFNCSEWKINDTLIKFGIDKNFRMKKEIILTNIQKEIIYGSLLGDGSILDESKMKSNSRFQYVSSNKNHVEYIASFFKDCTPDEYSNGPKMIKTYDKRTNKIYTGYVFRTQKNICFTKLRNIWYKNKIKIIPEFDLTPLIIKIWYIGDGYLSNSKKINTTTHIGLSTNCFNIKYIKNILKKLENFNAIKRKTSKNDQFIIIIPRIKVRKFLSYIGECPVKGYEYKWNYIPCKSENIDKNGFANIHEKEIINNYLSGMSIKDISKKYNCSSIYYYLTKNNVKLRTSK